MPAKNNRERLDFIALYLGGKGETRISYFEG